MKLRNSIAAKLINLHPTVPTRNDTANLIGQLGSICVNHKSIENMRKSELLNQSN